MKVIKIAVVSVFVAGMCLGANEFLTKQQKINTVTVTATSALTATQNTQSNITSSVWTNITDDTTNVVQGTITTNVTVGTIASNSVTGAAVLLSVTNVTANLSEGVTLWNSGAFDVNVYTSATVSSSVLIGVAAAGTTLDLSFPYPDVSHVRLYGIASGHSLAQVATGVKSNIVTYYTTNIVTDVSTNATVSISTNVTTSASTNTTGNTSAVIARELFGSASGTTPQ